MKNNLAPYSPFRSQRSLVVGTRLLFSVAAWLVGMAMAQAGGGPEGVLLVVNPESPASMTIANHYAKLRAIPADNIVYLPWPTAAQTSDIDTFRDRILLPLLTNIQKRGMADRIDAIVYSSDFPWAIALDSDVRKFMSKAQQVESQREKNSEVNSPDEKSTPKLRWPQQFTPVGSLNGLTYLWQPVMLKAASYFEPHSNYYMRPDASPREEVKSVGFRGSHEYDAEGNVSATDGRRYFLSAMLGVTTGRGNSLEEVLAYLERSAQADATHPKGTIYFVRNNDVRSKVRDEWFPKAVEELTKLGVKAEVLNGTVPLNQKDVQGVEMGTSSFDWKASGSTILAGALCDNFTSFGGVMRKDAGQTPLSEFLRFGAAGANGTVTEPFAIASKFPSPLVQVHYARGCTLAEAFYQSVQSPYQLLIVGDPLCRPWAEPPRVSVSGVAAGDVVHGTLTLKPAATLSGGQAVEGFLLYVDAQPVAQCNPQGTLALDTTKVADGHHELRVVAIGPGPIETQGRLILPVRFENHGRRIEAALLDKGPISWDATIRVAVHAPNAVGVVAIQGSRIVGHRTGEQGQIDIPAKSLGAGPVLLRVVGLGEGGNETHVMAQPLEFTVELNRPVEKAEK